MEDQQIIITEFAEWSENNICEYSDYYQFHIFSPLRIVSAYYNPDVFRIEDLKKLVSSTKQSIQKKTNFNLKVSLFQKDGIFIITDSEYFVNEEELFEFDYKNGVYEYVEGFIDIYELIGETKIDEFLKNAFTTVGANAIIPSIEKHIAPLVKRQNKFFARIEELRENDKTKPQYTVEIYSIEKNYIPKKIKEFKISTMESFDFLPEIRQLMNKNKRMTSLVKSIKTGKIIDGNIDEAIENIKYHKWLRKHPPVIDMEDMHRMELDNDDPNFLSWDDFVANDDEYEEGDDEYSPRF